MCGSDRPTGTDTHKGKRYLFHCFLAKSTAESILMLVIRKFVMSGSETGIVCRVEGMLAEGHYGGVTKVSRMAIREV